MFSSMLSLLGSLKGSSANFVKNSLRFRSSASAYLSRTFSGPTSSTVFTWSAWVKRGALTGTYRLFGASTNTFLTFNSSDQLNLTLNGTSAATSTAVFRDPSAWYHIVYTQNGAFQTLYVNQTSVATGTTANTVFNTAIAHQIGATNTTNFFDGYLTEVNFIDGQALTPDSFGAIDFTTGVWSPRPYVGSYGTNGFYLKFADASAATAAAIGKDSSGNGNNWTPTNISVTAGVTYDSMLDVPVNYADGGNGRGNYAVGNPLYNDTAATSNWSNGNLTYSVGNGGSLDTSIAVFSGKWYWENTIGASANALGVHQSGSVGRFVNSIVYNFDGTKVVAGTSTAYGATYTTNDIISVALDMDGGTVTFYKNNVSQGSIALSGASITLASPFYSGGGGVSNLGSVTFGQRPFTYTPPAGFVALNTNNLPTPSIVNGANYMAATTYTGNAAARSLTNTVNSVSFQPDLVWIKSRTPGATNHALFDSSRGVTKYLSSNTTTAETTLAQSLTAINADGFSLGTDTTLVNANANSYVAWQWKESITAGLDIVTYTGNGANRTIAHNLGATPAMILVKRYDVPNTGNWQVRHTSIAAANSIQLNATSAAAAAATVWNSTAPTSSVFSLGTSTDVNATGATYVAYCFAEIAGFSKFGSYTGNGVADGPFVFCGFRPRFVMIKRTDTAANWGITDTSRSQVNAGDQWLFTNLSDTEYAGTLGANIDVLSNGFKLRIAGGAGFNTSGGTYIFAAFAEAPSKYALAR